MFTLLVRLKRIIKRALKVRQRAIPSRRPRRDRMVRIALFVAAIIATGALYPQGDLLSPVPVPRVGEPAREDFIAPAVITIKKTEAEISEERKLALKTSPIVLDYDPLVADSALTQMYRFVQRASALKDSLKGDSARQFGVFAEKLSESFPFISGVALREAFKADSLDKVNSRLTRILRDAVYFNGALNNLETVEPGSGRPIIMRIGGRETIVPRDRAIDLTMARERLLSELNRLARDSSINVELNYEIGRRFIFANLKRNADETSRREKRSLEDVSEIKYEVQEGDLILRAGQPVTEREVEIIQTYANNVKRLTMQENIFKAYLPLFARMGLIAIIFALLYIYLKVFREDIFRSTPKIVAALAVVGLELVGIYICDSASLNLYVYPVALAPILYSILFDTRFGVVSSLFIAPLLGSLTQFDFDLTLLTVCAGSLGAYSAAGVRTRGQLLRTMFYLAIVGVSLALALGYLGSIEFTTYSEDVMMALLGAIVTPIVAAAALPFFESLFGFTTDITLLELSDLNRPLLKRLALEAPGTFNHSIVVGTLAEAAAKEIGANSLLARVGAYYHDIGKMEIAEYFVENQVGIRSKHDSITPTMSAVILTSHVKRGRKLAEEADLPDDVMNFIEEHHGTMVMTYFYRKALDQGAGPEIEPEFRYPGPRPQTKEAAILMLADGAEAASRTLDDPSPARIRNLIQKIIDDRYHSGQLEECPLTLADLGKIREAFAQILTGAFHQRVAYPTTPAPVRA